ncbi:MAG: hypothetical protein RLY97_2250 [Pseudomonadota bacterium]
MPENTGVTGELFDGTSARRRHVSLGWDHAGLTIISDGIADEQVAWADLHLLDTLPDARSYGHAHRAGWRLRVPHDAPAELLAQLPHNSQMGGWIDRLGLGKSIVAFALASAAVVALVMTAPTWLGPLVPETWERHIGEAMLGDLAAFQCKTPTSDAALQSLSAQLDPRHPPVQIELVKVDMVNAVAIPGGRVLVFDKLVQDAKTPDELAGVLGHEIGHVRKRHVMQALLREFGLSILLSGANTQFGNSLGQISSMSYSRQAENEADGFSRDRLRAANISPQATADFFARLKKHDPIPHNVVMDYLASHPDTAQREQAFHAAVLTDHAYQASLNPAQFAAIKNACAQDKRAKQWDLF